ncbi:MAG: HNH endonuclease [Clostridiaceae bacterium]|nr:HNH endonuclease [Clostridiaceae bacterium]
MGDYKTRRWKIKRELILKRDKYICRECKRYGRTTQANTVHHIYPLGEHPEYAWISINLISLCNKCHESMHNRFKNVLTEKGVAWKKRIEIELNVKYKKLVGVSKIIN